MNTDEIALQIESGATAPRVARRQLSAIEPALEPRFGDVLLVVSELVSNSVRHSDSDQIDVRVKADGDQIRVEVGDDGPGIHHSEVSSGNGFGLEIVGRLANAWGYGDGSSTVWAELSKSPTDPVR